jgi:HemK-related putative methylase
MVLPGVFSPKYFKDTFIFAEILPELKGKTLLEIGCGTGILSIFSIWKGAKEVTSVDINPKAVINTIENVKIHNLSKWIKVKESDIFSSISDKFDVILWNFPFLHINNNQVTLHEKMVFDPNYKELKRFVSLSDNYLNKEGFLLIGFSPEIGHIDKLKSILNENGFEMALISKKKSEKVSFELFKATKKINS